jgi:ribonuclease P protein component
MLAPKYRLTKEKDFKKINALGRSFFSPGLKLKYLANNQELSRFALVVSTKISKRATQRNRLKRQLREIIRLNQERVKAGYDIIISTKSPVLSKDYQELEKNVLVSLAKAGLLK